MKWQARDSWLREIREVLDDAARAVTQAVYAYDQRRSAGPERRDELGAAAYARKMDAEVAGNRIAMRVGHASEAAERWRDVGPALDELSTQAFELGGKSLEELPDEQRQKWTAARNEVAAKRDAFFAAAEAWLDEREWELPGRPRLTSRRR
jgi:hypothetical protein